MIEFAAMTASHIDGARSLLTGQNPIPNPLAGALEDLPLCVPPESTLSVVASDQGEVVGAALSTRNGQLRCVVVRPDFARSGLLGELGRRWEATARALGVEIPAVVDIVPEMGGSCEIQPD